MSDPETLIEDVKDPPPPSDQGDGATGEATSEEPEAAPGKHSD